MNKELRLVSQDFSEVEQPQSPEQRRQLLARLLRDQSLGQPKAKVVKRAPMSFAQQRLWFLEQLIGGSALYNMPCPQRFQFALDVDVLRRSLNEIVRRHEVLRTTFGVSGGTPAQIIATEMNLELPVEDLRDVPPQQRELDAWRLTTEDAHTPFDLRTGPLIRVKLLRLADDDYMFLLTIHHIVFDGWSTGVFFRELTALYSAFITGQPSPLPELAIQYSDFSVWQRDWLQGEVLERQLSYWKGQLADLTPLNLPADRTRPALPSFRGASHLVHVDVEVIDRLRSLCEEQDATLFMVLLAAFQVLLHRYSGQDDIVLGSPVANRNRAETEALIGFFVNPLVMRTSLAGDPSFRQLLDRVREMTLGAYANQDLPFEILVEDLHPERHFSHNPLFQIVFQLVSMAAADSGNTAQAPPMPTLQMTTSKFDLNLTLFETSAGVLGAIEYTTDLFDASRITRMAGHYAKLLDEIGQDPSQPISKLPLLTGAERRQILKEWNTTAVSFSHQKGVRGAFERNALKEPDAPAICFQGQMLTYRALEIRANQLAGYLREQGVAKDTTVAICLPRSPEVIVAALAVFKAGAAYLPIDPEYPEDRIALMMTEAASAVLVTTGAMSERLAGVEAAFVCLDRDAALIEQQAGTTLEEAYDEDALAYVIFTSGSTGTPKGVEIQHRGLTNLVNWHISTFGVGPGDRATQFAGLGFDAAVWEIWPYLAAGAAVQIVEDEIRYSPALFPEWITAHRITHCFIPTPILDTVLRQPWPSECRLRAMLTGGDKLLRGVPPELPFPVFNQYGPTENSVVTTSAQVAVDAGDGMAPPIGRPIWNVELFVIDRNGQPVPVGVPGELWIGGQGLARGYCNSQELTAQRFIQHPLEPEQKVYRSGDLVRYLPDGNIEFLGRIDEQVKIRGFRIEPGEIEAALVSELNVQSACIVAHGDTPRDLRLIAYLVAKNGDILDVESLREQLRAKLPAYMVPSNMVVLDEFPLTSNGKIDRRRLPLPMESHDHAGYVPPKTQLEKWLATIWQEEIHIDVVGVNENFFDIGGNSLILVQIHRRLEEKMPNRVSAVDLFRYPTIRTLAAFLGEQPDQETKVDKARERAVRRKQLRAQRRDEGVSV
ncbi:MAG TPA: amino acid adenylation domain-containing protein [Candidatus Angelobacter sp.]|nr:amino acid adenylation domain-containing protein [Candidatus Angelobacter sp.]